MRSNVLRLPPERSRADAGMSQAERDDLRTRRIAAARRLLAKHPTTTLRESTHDIAIATKRRCSTDRAREIRKYIVEHPEPVAAAQYPREETTMPRTPKRPTKGLPQHERLYLLVELAQQLVHEVGTYARQHTDHARLAQHAQTYLLHVLDALHGLWQSCTPMNPHQQQSAPQG